MVPGWNAGNCCGEPQLFSIDDVGFVRDLSAAAQRELCIDDKRIYALGFSSGGMFTHRIGCDQSYEQCADGTVEPLCTIDQGKHDWPDSRDGTWDIPATAELLRFFAKHTR